MGTKRETSCDGCGKPIEAGTAFFGVGIEAEYMRGTERVQVRPMRRRRFPDEEDDLERLQAQAKLPFRSATLDVCVGCIDAGLSLRTIVVNAMRTDEEERKR